MNSSDLCDFSVTWVRVRGNVAAFCTATAASSNGGTGSRLFQIILCIIYKLWYKINSIQIETTHFWYCYINVQSITK